MSDAPSATTLRSAEALRAAGLIGPGALDAAAAVADRYAVALTPAMADGAADVTGATGSEKSIAL